MTLGDQNEFGNGVRRWAWDDQWGSKVKLQREYGLVCECLYIPFFLHGQRDNWQIRLFKIGKKKKNDLHEILTCSMHRRHFANIWAELTTSKSVKQMRKPLHNKLRSRRCLNSETIGGKQADSIQFRNKVASQVFDKLFPELLARKEERQKKKKDNTSS